MTSNRILDLVWASSFASLGFISSLLQDIFNPRPPPKSRLERLPDELLLQICKSLPFDSFHCVSQSSRRLRDLCKDGSFKQREELRVEFWNMLDPHQPRVVPTLRNLYSLLQRDQFCQKCLKVIQDNRYIKTPERLQLEEKRYCFGCRAFHGTVLFTRCPIFTKGPFCLAWTGKVRICPHMSVDWHDLTTAYSTYWLSPERYNYPNLNKCHACICDMTSYDTGLYYNRGGSEAILQHSRVLPRLSRNLLKSGKEIYLDEVRKFCKNAEYQYLCPHLRLDNPMVVYALTRAIPRYCGLVNYKTWGDVSRDLYPVFKCDMCDCEITIGLNRWVWPSNTYIAPKCPVLIVRNKISIPSSGKPTRAYLAKLDPATIGDDAFIRAPFSEGFSWCKSPDCATTRRGRREARLLQDCW